MPFLYLLSVLPPLNLLSSMNFILSENKRNKDQSSGRPGFHFCPTIGYTPHSNLSVLYKAICSKREKNKGDSLRHVGPVVEETTRLSVQILIGLSYIPMPWGFTKHPYNKISSVLVRAQVPPELS